MWWLDAPRRLSRRASRAIESSSRVAISAITVLETADLVELERIKFALPTRQWMRNALSQVELLPLTAEIGLDAAQLRFARDPFDRVIYATARSEDALLVTRDERIHAFDAARAVW